LSTDFQVTDLHGFVGLHEANPILIITLSFAVVIFFINAFNLIDGIDGLASSLAAFYFGVFAVVFFMLREWALLCVSIALIGMFIAFLRYNLSTDKKIFMGDTGSLFIGFIIAAFVMHLMTSDYPRMLNSIQSANFGLFLIATLYVPVFDSIRVFVARSMEGRSPFSPDRNHIHHLLMDRFELSHRQTTGRILLFNILISLLFWLLGAFLPHLWVLVALLAISILFSFYLRNLRQQMRVKN
jgi:UDP-N-acetylmuramyl pentapeptide phosphotransferase/UDP-N-acetylglucosamine-1-phosphate transferase